METTPTVRFLDRTTPPHILTLVLLAGLGAMNMSAFLPSLPAMTEYFGTTYGVMQLSVSLYLATTAFIQLGVGPLSDRFGRRPINIGFISIFIVASLGCMMAPTVEIFLMFRMLQGAVAAAFVISRAIIRDMVPQEQAASMIGYVTMGMALVPMVAPMIGGLLDELFGWQATFLFLAGFGVFVMTLAWFDQGETAVSAGKPFSEQVKEYPELLRSRRFWGYVFAAAFASGAFFAFLGGSPYVATEVFGLSAFWSGVGFGAPAVGYGLGNFLSGRYSVRFGLNWMIRTGSIITAGGLGVACLLAAAGVDNAWLFFGSCTFVGIGNGLIMPNASAGMLSVRPQLAGTASGLGASILIGGGAGLSAFAGVVLLWGSGSLPLLLLMTWSAIMALVSVYYVERRERQLNLS